MRAASVSASASEAYHNPSRPAALLPPLAPGELIHWPLRSRENHKNQGPIAQWNLARLAETLLPLIAADAEQAIALAHERVVGFAALFSERYLSGMRAKLGLALAEPDDETLVQDLLEQMHASRADFTRTFRLLAEVHTGQDIAILRSHFTDEARFESWCRRWRARAARERTTTAEQAQAMRRVNPAFIPRNHRVEQVLEQAVQRGDLSAFASLSTVLARPYDDQPEHAAYAEPPPPEFGRYRTFCGT